MYPIQAPSYMELVTQLYFKGDQYLETDIVFAVRQSLITVGSVYTRINWTGTHSSSKDPKLITDASITLARGFKEAKLHLELKQDFVLVREQELVKPKAKV